MFLFGKKNQTDSQQQGQGQPPQGQPRQNQSPQKADAEKGSGDEDKKKADSIKSFINILKKQYSEGLISEKTFKETLAKNEEELKRIESGASPAKQDSTTKQKTDASAVAEAQQPSDNAAVQNAPKKESRKGKKKPGKENVAGDEAQPDSLSAENNGDAAGAKKTKSAKPEKGEDGSLKGSGTDEDESTTNEKQAQLKEEENAAPAPEKTVGEILKEQGVIHEDEKQGKIKIEQEVDMNKIVMDIEKLTAEVGALRDIKFQSDERIKEIAESIGEMRSLIFQRDGAIKEAQMKIEKLDDAVSDIKPEKIAGEMRKREQELMEEGTRIEKLERMTGDMVRQIKDLQKILDNIKSMKNLLSISKEIEEKLSKIEELKGGVERDAEKSEKMYLEMERRTQDFAQAKESIKKLDELTMELLKSMDEEKIKMGGLVSKEDLQKTLDAVLKPPVTGKSQEERAGEKQGIEALLKNLEMQYKRGLITKESYDEISEKNRTMLQILDKEIKEGETRKTPQSIFEWLAQIENELNEMRVRFSSLEKEQQNGMDARQYEPAPDNELSYFPEKQQEPVSTALEMQHSSEYRSGNESEINDIQNLLSEIEDQYREGIISEGVFEEIREKNLEKLRELESRKNNTAPARASAINLEKPAAKKVFKPAGGKKEYASKKINSLLEELQK